jgi:hypothetical protein
MPSSRRPKGTYVRPTMDWFISSSAYIGGLASGDFHSNAPFMSLYNNDTNGGYLYVYRAIISSNEFTQVYIDQQQGFTVPYDPAPATATPTPFPLNPLNASPPGLLAIGNWLPTLRPATAPTQLEAPGQGIVFSVDSSAPIWIIPATWTLNVYTISSDDEITATFWYTYLRDQG